MTEISYQIIIISSIFTFGALFGLKHGNPIYDIVEIVNINRPDTIRMRAFHTECWYVQDAWKEGIEEPIVADFIERRMP